MKFWIKVKPGAKEDKIQEIQGGYKASLKAAAQRGQANEALIKVLSDYFGVAKTRIRIVSGHSSRDKLIEVI